MLCKLNGNCEEYYAYIGVFEVDSRINPLRHNSFIYTYPHGQIYHTKKTCIRNHRQRHLYRNDMMRCGVCVPEAAHSRIHIHSHCVKSDLHLRKELKTLFIFSSSFNFMYFMGKISEYIEIVIQNM